MTKENRNIFILDQIYPEAEAIFQHSSKSLNEIKDDCFVVIDTNALLVPYTVNRKSIEEIHDTYSKLKESRQLVIPGQVAREFAENRVTKITELHKQLSDKKSKENPTKLENYPLLESMSEFKEALELSSEIERSIKKYREKLEAILDNIKNWIWDDPISEMYRKLFSTGVVIDLQIDDEEKKEIETDLDNRYKHKIPPGYKDSSKDDKGVGDLLIWKTILNIAQKHSKSVIFVSNDAKPDWWHQSDGIGLYPRYQLIYEFRRYSNQQSFHIVSFSDFLELYGASPDVLNDVRHEEKINFYNYEKIISAFHNNYIKYLNLLNRSDQYQEIEQKISNTLLKQFIETEEFAKAMANTTARHWSFDHNITNIDIGDVVCTVLVTFSASGTPDNNLLSRYEITAKAEAIIDESSEVTYRIINVKTDKI